MLSLVFDGKVSRQMQTAGKPLLVPKEIRTPPKPKPVVIPKRVEVGGAPLTSAELATRLQALGNLTLTKRTK